MDRKYSDPQKFDLSIDWDDEPDGSDGGYDRHGTFIPPSAMMEIVSLRAECDRLQEENRALTDERDQKGAHFNSLMAALAQQWGE